MRHFIPFIFCVLAVVLAPSCSTTVIPVDQLPADSTITNVELENYINRTYIALLNRKPSDAELATALGQLDVDRYDREIRSTYVLGLQVRPSSKWAAWQFLSDRLIDGIDTARIYSDQEWFQERYDNASSPGDAAWWGMLLNKSVNHINAMHGWFEGDTSYTNLCSWMVRLYSYDEINAGTENFVVSIYQHFFHRYPTDIELQQASDMVNNQWGLLYGKNGNSKADFLSIIFSSGEYEQGMVISLFESYYNRTPNTNETLKYLDLIQQNWTRTELQRYILTSSEYVNS